MITCQQLSKQTAPALIQSRGSIVKSEFVCSTQRTVPYYVYMTAGANKFLRIYYGKVNAFLSPKEDGEAEVDESDS